MKLHGMGGIVKNHCPIGAPSIKKKKVSLLSLMKKKENSPISQQHKRNVTFNLAEGKKRKEGDADDGIIGARGEEGKKGGESPNSS